MMRANSTYKWSRKHNSFFETNKLHLIDFTRKRERDPTGKGKTQPVTRQPLVLEDVTILPSSSHRLLGLILDQELRFHHHIAHTIAKGTDWTLQLWRLAKPTQGLSHQYTCQLYLSVVVPKMVYAADIWYTPICHSEHNNHTRNKKATRNVGFSNKLARVQHTATLHITGAMQSTTTDLLDTHADLLPIRFAMDKHSFNTTLQLLSLPPDHPLHPHSHKASHPIKQCRSSLHNLLQSHKLKAGGIETIHPSHLHPSWTALFNTCIHQD